MKRFPRSAIGLIGLLCLIVLCSTAGCSIQLPGFRFAPSEDQKTSAQAAADIASIASITGLPPGSDAAKQMAAGGRAAAAYLGSPAKALSADDLFPPAVSRAWATKEKQAEASALQAKIRSKGNELQTRGLAFLVANVGDRRDVPSKEFLPLAQALSLQAHMTEELAQEVKVPADVELSPAEQQRMDLLASALTTITQKAQEVAGLRPTSKEVVEKAAEQVGEGLDTIGGIIDQYPWLSALVASTPVLGGILYGRKKSKDAKAARAEAEAAKNGNGNGSAAAAGPIAAIADVAKQLTDALAKSVPAPVAVPAPAPVAVASAPPEPTPPLPTPPQAPPSEPTPA
jgi:hypothetical protein